MDISLIKLAFKRIFGGVSSALKYVLDVFNNLISREDIANRIEQVVAVGRKVLYYMDKWREWCPEKWRKYYVAVYTAIEAIVDTFSDGKVTPEEVAHAKGQFQIAYATWISED